MGTVLTSSGRRIFYDDLGGGPPVLLIPGMAGSCRGRERPLATALAIQHRVIAMDLRDCGESDPEPEHYTMADLASDAIALLDAFGLEQAHIAGFSLGGMVALQVGLDYPERLDRLVLLSTFASSFQQEEHRHHADDPLPPPPEWWRDDPVERASVLLHTVTGPGYRDGLDEGEVARLALAERGNRATWAGTIRQLATQADHDVRLRLGEIRVPTLVLHGNADPVVRLELGERVAAGIPHAELVVLPGVGHAPWVEQPEAVMEAILEFLGETR